MEHAIFISYTYIFLYPLQVDVRVMITFLEFYEVFMKFVLFKLYQTQGLRYPPTEDQQLMEAGCFLLAIKPTPIDAVLGSDVTSGDNDAAGMIESKDKCEIMRHFFL